MNNSIKCFFIFASLVQGCINQDSTLEKTLLQGLHLIETKDFLNKKRVGYIIRLEEALDKRRFISRLFVQKEKIIEFKNWTFKRNGDIYDVYFDDDADKSYFILVSKLADDPQKVMILIHKY